MNRETRLKLSTFLNKRLRTSRKPIPAKVYLWDELAYTSTEECITWPYRYTKGRPQVKLGKKYYLNVCRLLCEGLHGPAPTDEHHAAHSCGNGHLGCVNPQHLSWKTPKENSQDRYLHGTDQANERNPMAKLTMEKAEEIRARSLGTSTLDLAKEFGVSKSTIGKIVAGKAWIPRERRLSDLGGKHCGNNVDDCR